MKLSIIIPHCNEYQNLFLTVESLFMQFRRDPDLLSQVEILVVDNRSIDMRATPIAPTPDTHHAVEMPHRTRMTEGLQECWMAKAGVLRVIIYDAEQSHWKARQAGLDSAQGEYVMFCDAHVLHQPGLLQFGIRILDTCQDIGQLHGG